MNNRTILSLVSTLVISSCLVSGAAFAQTTNNDATIPNHGRINEIEKRLDNQQERIEKGVESGKINAKQEMRDEKRIEKINNQLVKDEAEHNGHITKAEQKHMNKELNRNSKAIHRQKHAGNRKHEEKYGKVQ